jgi:tetratricopeptide (TPR) repeat protein
MFRKFQLKDVGLASLLACVVLIAYLPSLNGSFIFDDKTYVPPPDNRNWSGLYHIWSKLGTTPQYYPATFTALWFEQRIWGDWLIGYHFTNVAEHTIAAWLIILLLRRLDVPGATLAGFIFALHPICVESVAYIAEEKNTLSLLLSLVAILLYLSFDSTRRLLTYVGATLIYMLALLCKTVVATTPGVLLVIIWWKYGRLGSRKDFLPLFPWLIIGGVAGMFSGWVEKKYCGAEGDDFVIPFVNRVLIAGEDIWFYLGKIVWPAKLTYIYPRWTVNSSEWWEYCFPISLVVIGFCLCFLAKLIRWPLAVFLIFIGSLFPVLGFWNIFYFSYSFVADHFQYFAMPAIIVPISAGIHIVAIKKNIFQKCAIAAYICIPVTLGILTWMQNDIYQDEDTIFQDTIRKNPSCWLAHCDLGLNLVNKGFVSEGLDHLQFAARLNPDSAEIHNNLGLALMLVPGSADAGLSQFEQALRIWPNFGPTQKNLAHALSLFPKRFPEAIEEYKLYLTRSPNDVDAHLALARLLASKPEESENAILECKTALKLKPDCLLAHEELGVLFAQRPDTYPEAIKEWNVILEIKPNSAVAHYNLGVILSQTSGRMSDALKEYKKALAIQPEYPEAHNELANALARTGQLSEAVDHYHEALRLKPDYREARRNLEVVLGWLGQQKRPQ